MKRRDFVKAFSAAIGGLSLAPYSPLAGGALTEHLAAMPMSLEIVAEILEGRGFYYFSPRTDSLRYVRLPVPVQRRLIGGPITAAQVQAYALYLRDRWAQPVTDAAKTSPQPPDNPHSPGQSPPR